MPSSQLIPCVGGPLSGTSVKTDSHRLHALVQAATSLALHYTIADRYEATPAFLPIAYYSLRKITTPYGFCTAYFYVGIKEVYEPEEMDYAHEYVTGAGVPNTQERTDFILGRVERARLRPTSYAADAWERAGDWSNIRTAGDVRTVSPWEFVAFTAGCAKQVWAKHALPGDYFYAVMSMPNGMLCAPNRMTPVIHGARALLDWMYYQRVAFATDLRSISADAHFAIPFAR